MFQKKNQTFRTHLERPQGKYLTSGLDLTNVKSISILLHFYDTCHVTRQSASFNCKKVTAFMPVSLSVYIVMHSNKRLARLNRNVLVLLARCKVM